MQCADNFHPCLDFSRRLQLAQSFVACGYDLGKILVQAEGTDFLEEGTEGRSCNSSAESLYKRSVLLQGRIEGLVDLVDIFKAVLARSWQYLLGVLTFLSIPSAAVQFAQFAFSGSDQQ